MTRLLGKTLLVITFILIGCDTKNISGRLVKMDGKYYRLDNRIGNLYALEPIQMDTIIILK